MPAVFVHGVPDTAHVWRAVTARLERDDVVTLALPGFGAALPPRFDPNKDAYASWVVDELAKLGGPVDVVGHDWGALLTVRAACLRPDLIRTWAVGGAPLDADYEWHEAARLWQTPEVGEAVMQKLSPDRLAAALAAAGVPAQDAREAASRLDDTMKRCILRLYRSAVVVGREWAPELVRLPPPGLVLWGEKDPYAEATWGRRLATATGAQLVVLPGCSHWWQLERPDAVAAQLQTLWRSIR